MPPKAATKKASKPAGASQHGTYQDMIKEAIVSLKERNGSSRQAIKKYVQANNNLTGVSDAVFTAQFNRALQKGSDSGVFARPKGTSGTVKLAAPTSKAAASTKTAAAKTTKAAAPKKTAAATKKTTTTKKAAAPKKAAATKKTTTTKAKAPAKKAATKTKANTGTKRKTPAAAPAVEEKAPVVLGKTKSGRVTKSTAPQAVRKTTAPKKAAARKATPKKSATPKKA
ncbi:Histone H1 [Cercospora beticola]|uniref:Histone H1 n=1 Tax=Cercospora beticola TaxID=122368 RepID=A0A2G5HGK8_CERBT|nr:Histone H1 [Cercospora beticola]PIA91671.1 Histone H1 [Cercospora beticola]WPB06047.1 hypothetical protein RHO25_010703 [Cercospora beticola]CAK1365930.1 unnamed protein product [Cercospora beticola]